MAVLMEARAETVKEMGLKRPEKPISNPAPWPFDCMPDARICLIKRHIARQPGGSFAPTAWNPGKSSVFMAWRLLPFELTQHGSLS